MDPGGQGIERADLEDDTLWILESLSTFMSKSVEMKF